MARERGLKPTARLFSTTVPTVRKWLRRYRRHGSRLKPKGEVAKPSQTGWAGFATENGMAIEALPYKLCSGRVLTADAAEN